MITEKEEQATLLSPTKKDYYQIWNELMDLAGKISERWTPSSTNESDPGVVLLKVLTACADKLNYNIDKNILEAFMPSAAQEESMRKLCDMMGYSMKYYQAASTDITVSYIGENALNKNRSSGTLFMPKYTIFTDTDNSIQFITTRSVNFDNANQSNVIPAIEGTLYTCEEENDGIVTLSNIDDNYRYYLPKYQVAENGIFIHNYVEGETAEGDEWEKKDNLNCQALNNRYYKFGYDSKQQMPYIQFPEDISSLIDDGLVIEYVTTNGVNGNISSNTITTFELPSGWNSNEESTNNNTGLSLSLSDFVAYNASATESGCDKETLNSAYNNFKKTVGTFDTLVTCRDYMNKIYNLTVSETDNTSLVSNDIVADLRDDINSSYTLCTFDEYGINYVNKSITTEVTRTDKKGASYTIDEDIINNFDLILYPFQTVLDNSTAASFQSSFKYDNSNYTEICEGLEDYKTVSHNIKLPTELSLSTAYPPIACIKNYLQLNAKITTTAKVNSAEQTSIKKNIFKAIYEKFNARQLDFGEAIPFDDILTTIENADVRIKNVSLDEPTLFTKVMLTNNEEYDIGSTSTELIGKQVYNQLALRNILAGRIALFNYNTEFTPSIAESGITVYPSSSSSSQIKYITSSLDLTVSGTTTDNPVELQEHQIVQFRAPNFKTTITYPAYVNYYISLTDKETEDNYAIPATFQTLEDFMVKSNTTETDKTNWVSLMDSTDAASNIIKIPAKSEDTYFNKYGIVFTRTGTGTTADPYRYTGINAKPASWTGDYYILPMDNYSNYGAWNNWIQKQTYAYTSGTGKLQGIYKIVQSSQSYNCGYMIDVNKCKFMLNDKYTSTTKPLTNYYVQFTYSSTENTTKDAATGEYKWGHTYDGFGKDAVYNGLTADAEYQLGSTEYLCINYTDSSSSVDNSTETATVATTSTVVNKYYGPGTIIKPNFALIDSLKKKSSGTSYSKTQGYSFTTDAGAAVSIPGMYSLGTDEQIEIREQAKTYIYNKNNDSISQAIKIYFKLNNEPGGDDDIVPFATNGDRRQLTEGEYFWYTDINETVLYYYGNGTMIINNTGNTISKKADAQKVTTEKILEEGLDAIPWIVISGQDGPVSVGGSGKYIEADEYQYVTLMDNDEITSITIDSTETDTGKLTSTWKKLNSSSITSYICDGEEGKLPKISVDSGVCWEARTKLELNIGPSVMQTIKNVSNKYTESIKLYNADPDTGASAIETLDTNNTTIESNYSVNSTDDKVQTYYTYGTDDETYTLLDDFMIKAFTNNPLKTYTSNSDTGTTLTVGNMDNYYTKIAFNDATKDNKRTEIYCSVPSTTEYGLLMIYYVSDNTSDKTKLVYINPNDKLEIFNNNGSWWSNYKDTEKYYLKPNAVNVIKFNYGWASDNKLTIYAGDSKTDVIIIGPYRLVDKGNTDGINIDILQYRAVSNNVTAANQLLTDINSIDIDHNFYYNAVIDPSIELDINTYNGENLATESIWYDYNNINNKFVISEINTEDGALASGITIAKSSQKNY